MSIALFRVGSTMRKNLYNERTQFEKYILDLRDSYVDGDFYLDLPVWLGLNWKLYESIYPYISRTTLERRMRRGF